MNKNIILAGAVAIGIYFLSQAKKIPFIAGAQRSPSATTSMVRQRTAQKIAQKVAQKIAQKVAPKRIGQPITQAARIAALRKAAARKAAQKIAQKVAPKRIGQPITQAARIAALRKAAARKAAAQKIGKKIGKTVAQSVAQKIKARRAAMARAAKRQRPQIQRPYSNKKQVLSWKAPRRFPNSKFRVITPSNILQNLAKKDIARKKAEQQKTAQKTTPSTPSARRKKRLEALYGSHWQDIWSKRQKR